MSRDLPVIGHGCMMIEDRGDTHSPMETNCVSRYCELFKKSCGFCYTVQPGNKVAILEWKP